MVEGEGGRRYQFAATMGLLLMLMRLDLIFWRMRGREDLFFFFWRGRAIFWKGLGAAKFVYTVREKGLGIMKFGIETDKPRRYVRGDNSVALGSGTWPANALFTRLLNTAKLKTYCTNRTVTTLPSWNHYYLYHSIIYPPMTASKSEKVSDSSRVFLHKYACPDPHPHHQIDEAP